MNRDLLDIVRRLQQKLEGIDADADKSSLIWAHGFLAGLLARLESRVPELVDSSLLEKKPQAPVAKKNANIKPNAVEF